MLKMKKQTSLAILIFNITFLLLLPSVTAVHAAENCNDIGPVTAINSPFYTQDYFTP
jgi:hypothetical protein